VLLVGLLGGCHPSATPLVSEQPPNDPARAVPEGIPPSPAPPDSAVEETSGEARYRREAEEQRLRKLPPPSPCPAIAAEYAKALAEARSCDPARSSSCSDLRISLASSLEADRFCGCRVRVDGRRTARLDEILARFNLEGCRFAVCSCPEDPGPACQPLAAGGGGCR
jgi:hypothetical protein